MTSDTAGVAGLALHLDATDEREAAYPFPTRRRAHPRKALWPVTAWPMISWCTSEVPS